MAPLNLPACALKPPHKNRTTSAPTAALPGNTWEGAWRHKLADWAPKADARSVRCFRSPLMPPQAWKTRPALTRGWRGSWCWGWERCLGAKGAGDAHGRSEGWPWGASVCFGGPTTPAPVCVDARLRVARPPSPCGRHLGPHLGTVLYTCHTPRSHCTEDFGRPGTAVLRKNSLSGPNAQSVKPLSYC